MLNKSGKAITIFIVVNGIVLICLAGITSYLYYTERELRETAEYNYDQMKVMEEKLQIELKEAKRQIFLYEEQIKEADKTIEDKMAEVEFEQGLREELKKENLELKTNLENETNAKEELRTQLSKDLSGAEQKITELQEQLKSIESQKNEMMSSRDQLKKDFDDIKRKLKSLNISFDDLQASAPPATQEVEEGVDLKKIVVNPTGEKEGRIISVDQQTDFIITNLGSRDGVAKGALLAIYRQGKYLGDVKTTRVLPEMSAADFVPPLKSQDVSKDDQVNIKN